MPALLSAPSPKIVMDGARVGAMLRGPNGPVMRHLLERAQLVQEAAKRQVRIGHVSAGLAGTKNAKGSSANLRESIKKRIVMNTEGPGVWVGSDVLYAIYVHEGTKAHPITPRTATVLYFFSQKAGTFVFRPSVMHLETKPNRFLTDNLRLAVL